MTRSSFYVDGDVYSEAVAEDNTTIPSDTEGQTAPSSMYPNGTVYETLHDSDVVLAEMTDLRNQTANSAAAAETSNVSAAAHDASASAHDASATAHDVSSGVHDANAAASASASASSAANALVSETNSHTSEVNSAASAATATTQAGIATTKASQAATSATNAATSETNGATSASNAHTSEVNAAASAVAAAAAVTSALMKDNNLSDLTNVGTAKTNLGLNNVDNTSDASKPVSTAQSTAINLRVPLTYLDTDITLAANSDAKIATQKATKSAIAAAIAGLINSSPGALDTLNELAASLGNDPNFATTVTNALALKLVIANNLSDLQSASTALTNLGLTSNAKSLVTAANYAAMKTLLSLNNVDNTSDLSKPVSTAQAAADALKSSITRTRRVPTGADTFVIGDAGNVVMMNSATAVNWTVPTNASVPFPIETQIDLFNYGFGLPTLTTSSGVVIRSADNKLKIAKQYGSAMLYKIGTDEWLLSGNLTS